MTAPLSLHWQLWGKAMPQDPIEGPRWHPLVAHMLDVAACAQVILTRVRPGRLDRLATGVGLEPELGLPWLLLFVVLHDLGKATPPFQAMVEEPRSRLAQLGFDFPAVDEPHGEMTAVLLPPVLKMLGIEPALAKLVARSVGAHHGSFAELSHLHGVEDNVRKLAGTKPAWGIARAELVEDLIGVFGVSRGATPRAHANTAAARAFAVDLAGLTTAADWLGSNADIFKYVEPGATAEAYFERAKALAEHALDVTGFRPAPRAPGRTFEALFGNKPWPLHEAMADVLVKLEPGSLVIVEAPMGEGKTEAALLAFDVLSGRGADGLYFALPTQATANQILGRVERYLRSSFAGAHGLHLVHGGAGLSDRYEALKKNAFRARSIDGPAGANDGEVVADAWFARSKRALLAPFGVGTVDQSLLAVLRSKHHFLRLHGLAGKVFVVDEVHAYDTFTSEILARLCEWLRHLGATVLLLSATLSSPQKQRLLAAYGAETPAGDSTYPRLTVAGAGQSVVVPFRSRRATTEVHTTWKHTGDIRVEVERVLGTGGCVAWIVNTVRAAQRLYLEMRALRDRLPADRRFELGLLHARLPFSERLRREETAEASFGPRSSARPLSSLLIGTQVLEQSLDLDFDLMITELAPVDLVLQRAGRLHRHDRPSRPPGLEQRNLWIEAPEHTDRPRGPSFGSAEYVYDEAILLRSFLALRGRTRITLPTDIEPLVEAVYASTGSSGLGAEFDGRLAAADEARGGDTAGESFLADQKLLPSPAGDENPFAAFNCFRFDDEDPAVHEALRAVTRLGERSVTVVPVTSVGSRLRSIVDPAIDFEPTQEISPRVALALARSAMSVAQKQLVYPLLRGAQPRAFERSGLLRHHRALVLDEHGHARIGGTDVTLDPELGLVIGSLDPATE